MRGTFWAAAPPRRLALRTAAKTFLLLVHLQLALVLSWLLVIDLRGWLPRQRLVRWWQGRLLAILNVRVLQYGNPHPGPRLTVANHVSWLDICVIASLEDTRFVAKSEIASWPVAGTLAQACRTFYIRRGKGGSGPLLERVVPFLRHGGSVTVFPEGTTSDGSGVLEFHPRLFSAALEAGVPVQPVALDYGPDSRGRRLAPFVGEDDLLGHLLRLMASTGLTVAIRYFDVLPAGSGDREVLAARARTRIQGFLGGYPRGRGLVPADSPAENTVINL